MPFRRIVQSMRVKLTWISTAALALALFSAFYASADVVYRWTDDDGKVHYTPTLPPEAANRPYDILSTDGRVLERITDPGRQQKQAVESAKNQKKKGPKPLYSEEEKQVIGDRLLLLKYHSEQEILDAMQLEIDHLKYDERLLKAGHDSAMTSLGYQIRSAANLQRAGQPVPENKLREIRQLQSRILANRRSNSELNLRKEKIRAGFYADLERYRELQEMYRQTSAEG